MHSFKTIFQKIKKPTKIRTILVGATALSVGFTAAIVYIPWLVISTRNIEDLAQKIDQVTAQNTSSEVNLIFESAQSTHQLLRKSSDRDILSLEQRSSVEKVFLAVLESRPNVTWIMFGYPNGDFFGVQRQGENLFDVHSRKWNPATKQSQNTTTSYEVKNQSLKQIGEKTRLDAKPFYAPERPWYKAAQEKPGETAWSTYVRRTNNQPTLDAAIALKKNDNPIGVLNLGFDLDQISRILKQYQKDKKSLLFITNSQAQLLASSDLQEVVPKQVPGQDDPQLNLLKDVSNPVLRGIVQEFKQNNAEKTLVLSPRTFRYRDPQSGEYYFVQLISLNKLDWMLGVVTPESLYLDGIRKNEIILGIVILVCIAVALGVTIQIIDRILARPIVKLNKAARQVAKQEFTSDSLEGLIQRPDELGELAQAINKMAIQVDGREQDLKKQMKQLRHETEAAKRQTQQANSSSQTSEHNPYSLIQRAQILRQSLQESDLKTPS